MNRIITILAALLLPVCTLCAQPGFGTAQKFNSDWKFSLAADASGNPANAGNPAAAGNSASVGNPANAGNPNAAGNPAEPGYDDSAWRTLELPHDWSIEGRMDRKLASCTGYLPGGIGWYRKHFSVDELSSRHYIYFEGVYNRSEVYLNGELLGKRPNGYVSFMYDMSDKLKEGDNVLAVRVDHSRSADSRWYTGSGIYRDVWLVTSADSHFDLWGVGWTSDIGEDGATLDVQAQIVTHKAAPGQEFELRASLSDQLGREVASASSLLGALPVGRDTLDLSLSVREPKRWDIASPYLYTLRTELLESGSVIDSSSCSVGFRTLDFDADKGFALNSRTIKVKGVCLHHDAGVLGAAVPPAVWERRLIELKRLGVNAIRCSHNPQAPVLYDLCDRLGLLVMDEASDEWEFPKRKWLKGWNVGIPGYEGTFDFFEEWIERDVTDMVRRDRNHPCIFLWSIGNEVDYPNDPYSHPILDGSTINQPMFGGYKPDAPDARRIGVIAQRLAECVRKVDRSRPVTGALAGVVMSNQTSYPQAVDVVGYNYTEDRYDLDHATYPDRIIYGSENSATYDAWKAVVDRDFIFGQFIWTGLDYLGEARSWPSRGLYTGLLDYAGLRKPRGWFRASLWSEEKTTYIGTYKHSNKLLSEAWDSWNYKPGEKVRVVCYTNSPQARLLLNGQEYGEMKPYDPKTGIICWDVDFSEGELKAQGCSAEGKVESEYSVTTSRKAHSLKAKVLEEGLDANLRQVLVEIVDERGIKAIPADNQIRCEISGGARLLGLESGSNTDMSDHRDNVQRAFRGNLVAYLLVDGPAEISFSSPGLESCTLKF